jgi:hypothetical protein
MSLASALSAGPPPDPRRKCGLATWIGSLPDTDRAAAQAAVDSDTWGTQALHRAFVVAGFGQTSNVITRHRNGACACESR